MMTSEQRLVVVPPAFYNSTQVTSAVQNAMVSDENKYFSYAKSNSSVVAVFPFHYEGFEQVGTYYDGATEMPIVQANIEAFGNSLTGLNSNSSMSSTQGDGAGDFNGDGTSDILWYNNKTGQLDIWYSGVNSNDILPTVIPASTGWSIVGKSLQN
jgi:hypothetical protein